MATETSTRRATRRAPASGEKNGTPLRELGRVFRIIPSRSVNGVRTSARLELGVQGEQGAVQLDVALHWYVGDLPAKSRDELPPQGIGLHVHRRTPADRPGFPISEHGCEWLDGVQCFPEHLSPVMASDLALDLRDRGDGPVWEELERIYAEHLG